MSAPHKQMIELKPCPFCGGVVKLEKTIRKGADGRDWWGVVCRNTKNLGGTCAVQIRPSASPEAAAARWNTRAPPNEDEVRVPRQLYDFLMGEGSLDGVWFGDDPLLGTARGAFWWRKALSRAALAKEKRG